jgi:outer membrane lipoprotein-sorting protein
MIITQFFKKKIFGTLVGIFLVIIFSIENSFSDNKNLSLIQGYLENMTTLEAKFFQTNPSGDILTGTLFVKKPGKIRFSYDPPSNLQIVSKQKAILIFDPKSKGSGPLTYPLSSTPLAFFIEDDLNSLLNENGESFQLDSLIFLKVRNPQYQISIEFNKKPMSLVGWEFKNKMGETIKVTLDYIQENNYISNEIFKTDKDYERIKR